MNGRTRRPPAPRAPEWFAAGLCIGMLVAAAELAAAIALEVAPPLGLGLLLAAALALAAAVPAGLAGLALSGRDRSLLLAAGVVLAGASVAPAWQRAFAALPGWAALLLLALLVALLGFAAVRLARRSEAHGQPPAPLPTWGGAALAAAAAAALLAGPESGRRWIVAVAGVLGVAALWGGLRGLLGREQGAVPRYALWLPGLSLLCLAVAAAPRAAPWLLFDRALPPTEEWPPSFLHLTLELAPGAELGSLPSLALLDGVLYEHVVAAETSDPLLVLPDGGLLGSALFARGYASADLVADPARGALSGARELDARPGGAEQLEGELSWASGAALLRGPAAPLVARLGYGERVRDAAELGAEGARWLVRWRTLRAPAPFFLHVDFRGAAGDASAVDRGIAALWDELVELRVDDSTLIVVSAPAEPARALVSAPAFFEPSGRTRIAEPISGRWVAAEALRVASSAGPTALRLPGIAEPLLPAGLVSRRGDGS